MISALKSNEIENSKYEFLEVSPVDAAKNLPLEASSLFTILLALSLEIFTTGSLDAFAHFLLYMQIKYNLLFHK